VKQRLLDLFCGAGGAAVGYYRAGFDVVGVDNRPQPHYPFEFHQADALEYLKEHGCKFDVIHASPPCQCYAQLTKHEYPDLIPAVRAALMDNIKPYVIENIPTSPLEDALMLCGTMFGLRVFRHRLFESFPKIYFAPAMCNHWGKSDSLQRRKGQPFITVCGNFVPLSKGRVAMGIEWMSRAELTQAIPPAYTEFIGRQIIANM
jgi:DNA (cytosine-5)-methyltransferase 1